MDEIYNHYIFNITCLKCWDCKKLEWRWIHVKEGQHSYGLEDMKSIHVYDFSYEVAFDAMGLIWKTRSNCKCDWMPIENYSNKVDSPNFYWMIELSL